MEGWCKCIYRRMPNSYQLFERLVLKHFSAGVIWKMLRPSPTYRHKLKRRDCRSSAFFRVGYRLSRFEERSGRGARAVNSFPGTEARRRFRPAPEVLWRGSSSVRITIHPSQPPVLRNPADIAWHLQHRRSEGPRGRGACSLVGGPCDPSLADES